MKARLETKYLPANYEQLVYEDMLRWMQGLTMSVDHYTEKFHDLSVRSQVMETDQQTLARYLRGLRSDIRRNMFIAKLFSVNEAYQLALQLEKQQAIDKGKLSREWPGTSKPISLQNTDGETGMLSEIHLHMEIRVRPVPIHPDHNATNVRVLDTLQQCALQKKKR